jgi:hypothetical protein
MTKLEWDVSDIDPITMFPKDCRYYNGGFVVPAEDERRWQKGNRTKPARRTRRNPDTKPVIFIDRLRSDDNRR